MRRQAPSAATVLCVALVALFGWFGVGAQAASGEGQSTLPHLSRIIATHAKGLRGGRIQFTAVREKQPFTILGNGTDRLAKVDSLEVLQRRFAIQNRVEREAGGDKRRPTLAFRARAPPVTISP